MANKESELYQLFLKEQLAMLSRQISSCQARVAELAFSKEEGAREEMYKIKGRMDQAQDDFFVLEKMRPMAIKADRCDNFLQVKTHG